MAEAQFEVVKSNVDGWDVRRVGEAQPLTNHATKEEAEEAARIQAEQVHKVPGDDLGQAVDIRQDVFSEDPDDEDLDVKRTGMVFTAMTVAVIVLVVALAVAAALTGFGG
jgi:hypothetical protein